MKTAIYKMSNNQYLGDCIAIVIKLREDEKPESFTRDEAIILQKQKV